MRVSREKIIKLSHVVTDALAQNAEVHFHQDRNDVRLAVRKLLEVLFTAEAHMDEAVRLKITSQKKNILEGSEEWDILYRKYYHDELNKLGV